ncbi:MAG: lipopolysaccharide assembly protein LapA domain-containing protein [Firmicutes bacterium]|nr:lipopolysaccharide assembly protein LapA domain-containing protein [Bacillota bacterium]
MLRLVFALLWALLVAIFAVQNSNPVPISFLFWRVPSISEALIILLSVLLGAVLASAVHFMTRRRRRKDPEEPPKSTPSLPAPTASEAKTEAQETSSSQP